MIIVQVGQGGLRDGTRIEPLNAAEVGWGEAFREDSLAETEQDSALAQAD